MYIEVMPSSTVRPETTATRDIALPTVSDHAVSPCILRRAEMGNSSRKTPPSMQSLCNRQVKNPPSNNTVALLRSSIDAEDDTPETERN
jgi:hypothetical protein